MTTGGRGRETIFCSVPKYRCRFYLGPRWSTCSLFLSLTPLPSLHSSPPPARSSFISVHFSVTHVTSLPLLFKEPRACVRAFECRGEWSVCMHTRVRVSLQSSLLSFFFLPLRWEGLLVDRRVRGATDYITVRNKNGAYKDRSLSSLRILIGDWMLGKGWGGGVWVDWGPFCPVSLSFHT